MSNEKGDGKRMYDFSRAVTMYANRSMVIPSDEEIVLSLGVEDIAEPGKTNVLANVYLTLPAFLRTYDAFKTILDDFKQKGMFSSEDS